MFLGFFVSLCTSGGRVVVGPSILGIWVQYSLLVVGQREQQQPTHLTADCYCCLLKDQNWDPLGREKEKNIPESLATVLILNTRLRCEMAQGNGT